LEFSGSILVVSISGCPCMAQVHHSILFTFCSSRDIVFPSSGETLGEPGTGGEGRMRRTNLPEALQRLNLLVDFTLKDYARWEGERTRFCQLCNGEGGSARLLRTSIMGGCPFRPTVRWVAVILHTTSRARVPCGTGILSSTSASVWLHL